MSTEQVCETQLLVLVDGTSIIGVQAIDVLNLFLFLSHQDIALSLKVSLLEESCSSQTKEEQ